MNLLNGKEVKLTILKELKEKLESLNERLGLAVIQIGDDPASSVYVRQKENMARNLNYFFKHIKLAENTAEEEVISLIKELNNDDQIDGILVQMPMPSHLDSKRIQNMIDPLKDVDGLTDINIGRLISGTDCLTPCTPTGIIDLLKYYNIELAGKKVTIVGRSLLVGKPLASMMTNHNATVILCHSKTANLHEHASSADILVSAVGKPKIFKKEDIKDNAVVIDVGINRMEDGSLCGDVDFDDVKDKTSYITPVPGGVGQMTVAELGVNTYKAHILRRRKDN